VCQVTGNGVGIGTVVRSSKRRRRLSDGSSDLTIRGHFGNEREFESKANRRLEAILRFRPCSSAKRRDDRLGRIDRCPPRKSSASQDFNEARPPMRGTRDPPRWFLISPQGDLAISRDRRDWQSGRWTTSRIRSLSGCVTFVRSSKRYALCLHFAIARAETFRDGNHRAW